ncbi:DUF305 domain-containing protein [Streptomyces sp. WSLK1-5]|uniref:DUF305 domain-containing protein n=1 Tax=unclassified Streptomyces TaxID=2593676 RepID=UPI000F64D84A|nr:DUF305 domain-containing protein [Streptomyces sp. RP5T]RRR86410.1 DUF305 domain-containing protein [Streptomyces sp. RP5T]
MTGEDLARGVARGRLTELLLPVAAVALLVAALLLTTLSGRAPAGAPVPAEDSVAVGFSRDMAVHHQQAVEMSLAVLRAGASPQVRTLAYDIANTQATQRGMMLGWLQSWGRTATSGGQAMRWMNMPAPSAADRRAGVLMPGMADRADMARLSAAHGRQADQLYLRLMIDHHRGGVHMAEAVTADGDTPQPVLRLAQGMVRGQRAEIALMESLLTEPGDGNP